MPPPPGSDELVFFVNGRKVTERDIDPEVTLLTFLRRNLGLTGTKSACGGGGCGACTVMLSRHDPASGKPRHVSIPACLVPLCSLHGAAITTVEGVGSIRTRVHPVQERIARSHGTQCGFCTPGMVMSLYTLLRNHPQPSEEQLADALAGNLCRCTGYRPILESGRTFCSDSHGCGQSGAGWCCLDRPGDDSSPPGSSGLQAHVCSELLPKAEFQPWDPSQEPIFPPELTRMAESPERRSLTFRGDRVTWVSPGGLRELLELKAQHPEAPLVLGNTALGPASKPHGRVHPLLISPARVPELSAVTESRDGLTIGAGCSLAQLQDVLAKSISELPEEKTQTLRALATALRKLAGQQVRNLASLGGHVMSRQSSSDLNPILAVGRAALHLLSEGGARLMPLDELFLAGTASAGLRPGEILESVHVPYSRKREFVSGFRQAQAPQNAMPHVSAGMRVLLAEGTNAIEDLSIAYGGLGATAVMAPRSCQQLLGKPWTEETLDEACRLVLGEVAIPGPAPGGRVEFRRTLLVSFLFRFYLQVLRELRRGRAPGAPSTLSVSVQHWDIWRYPRLPDQSLGALEDLPVTVPQGMQTYQRVDPQQPSQDPVGRPVMHLSGLKHATGEAVFCDDLPRVDRELSMALVTSTRPHARIVSVDPAEALRLPGVADVITAKDIPGTNGTEDDRLLAVDEVLCVGQVICAVVAETDEQAKRATERVRVTYEDLEPVVFSIQDAMRQNSFLCPEKKLEQGNVEEAFEKADRVIEGEVHVGGQEHFYMETQRVLVIPKAGDGELDIYASTQDPAHVQKTVSLTLNVPHNQVTCHVKRVGGGFGGKVGKPAALGAIAAVGAIKTGRAVRLVLDREDDMLITGGRHPLFGKYKVGFKDSGRIKALDIECYINGGCTLGDSELVTEFLILKLENAYKIRNLRFRGRACRTNLPSNTAFRGFGFPQGALVTEACITAVAAKCGLPPEKVREKNMYKTVDKTIYKQAFSPEPLRQCWAECLERADLPGRRARADAFNQQNPWRKRGVAAVPMKFSVGFAATSYHQAAALVHVYTDGSVLVAHGGSELGQGIHTKMLQVASRELRVPMSRLHTQETSTATVPNTVATAASIGADANGKAVQNACQTLLKRLEPIIKKNAEGTWEDWIEAAFEQRISLSATGYFRGYKAFMDWEKGEGEPFPYYVFGAACSEVEIDCLTGAHRKLRTDIVMDAGCSLNPALDVGQVEGAFLQGAGLYTSEELHYSPEGALLSRGPAEYKIPTAADVPEELNVTLLPSSQTQLTLYSSKGLGESGMFLGSSVFFAISDAVTAARRDRGLAEDCTVRSPATPERVRMACQDRFTEMIPREDPGTAKPWSIPIA
ncbi:PREDICTED: aldehyde oxidase 2 isoform X1 [Chinchilla lanigera]|uniref:aldehyde oxidase 2 isoform X1 n=1 Tax=Chinchilla lanigera TaxID=34839 RepID=UPI0006982C8B|nr:PREDICTED: aldehyde oxidase 2 isoform X1 [Chinchilla lanigera]